MVNWGFSYSFKMEWIQFPFFRIISNIWALMELVERKTITL
ncbi:hypothetical protein M089_5319, partial [Bacteroides ovatus str. 3725 D9 iii]